MQFGVTTFGDVGGDVTPAMRLKGIVEQAVLAEEAGLDVFAVGEHHRSDYAVSAPPVVLGAIASRTSRIQLGSAVTVLSSEDPVRLFQQFATLDLLSGNRAELWAGRGSFIESFPLFGFDLKDYDLLFAERLDLLLAIRETEKVTWSGQTRPSLDNAGIYPRPERELPIWIAVGGTPQSVVRAAALGLPLVIAIIGGEPERFKPFYDLYRRSGNEFGTTAQQKTALKLHGFVAETSQKARDLYWQHYGPMMTKIGKERGWSGMTREQFDWACGATGNLAVGSPQEVAEKISRVAGVFAPDRFLLQMTAGGIAQADLMRSIELFGSQVVPAVEIGTKIAA
jgi:probable LLM family oxidoreductase